MHCQPHYVRCIKSNDQRRALYPDPSRMLHQVKYLGLAENIKVRRAGFAFRCEYKRFFDRYYILTKITSRKWRGAHVDGCKAIMKAVSEIIPTIVSNPNEVQYGRSIIFIKHPETYNALNILRKDRISRIPVVIQRAWRTYLRKILLKTLSGRIGELYRVNKKIRK